LNDNVNFSGHRLLYEFLHKNLNRSFYSYLQLALEAHEVSGGVAAITGEGDDLSDSQDLMTALILLLSVLVSLYLI
jgi:hypothetical protein